MAHLSIFSQYYADYFPNILFVICWDFFSGNKPFIPQLYFLLGVRFMFVRFSFLLDVFFSAYFSDKM